MTDDFGGSTVHVFQYVDTFSFAGSCPSTIRAGGLAPDCEGIFQITTRIINQKVTYRKVGGGCCLWWYNFGYWAGNWWAGDCQEMLEPPREGQRPSVAWGRPEERNGITCPSYGTLWRTGVSDSDILQAARVEPVEEGNNGFEEPVATNTP